MSWFFKDPQGHVQGPFDDGSMRAWLEAGYLAADLPLCQGDPRKNQFRKLAEWFPNAIVAFLPAEQVKQMATVQGPKEGEWYFLDKSQKVQGPFSDFHMRQWHLAGYFEPTLLLMNRSIPGSDWAQLKQMFPNTADAFLVGVGGGGGAAAGANGSKAGGDGAGEKARFDFPEWFPVPPRFKGGKKTYPSEAKSGHARTQVAITDVHGQQVSTFAHGR